MFNLKVFWDWTFCHIREVEIGQFSLTTIYTIYTWIKINILNGQRFYFSVLLERIRIILIVHDPGSTSQKHFSCQMYSSIMMGYLQKNSRKKCLLSSLLHLKLLIFTNRMVYLNDSFHLLLSHITILIHSFNVLWHSSCLVTILWGHKMPISIYFNTRFGVAPSTRFEFKNDINTRLASWRFNH